MSGGKFKKSEEQEIDFELNLASIIDCFTVLITYLLVSASFISFGILDITVAAPASAEAAPPPSEPALSVTIALGGNNALEVKTEGAETKTYPLPARNGSWDLETLKTQLEGFKARFPKLDTAMVTADDRIEYKEVVKTVESVRATIPNVSLGTDQIGVWAQ